MSGDVGGGGCEGQGGADVSDRVLGRYAGRGAVKTACRGPSERLRVPLSATECH
jgi:hypothetical protein